MRAIYLAGLLLLVSGSAYSQQIANETSVMVPADGAAGGTNATIWSANCREGMVMTGISILVGGTTLTTNVTLTAGRSRLTESAALKLARGNPFERTAPITSSNYKADVDVWQSRSLPYSNLCRLRPQTTHHACNVNRYNDQCRGAQNCWDEPNILIMKNREPMRPVSEDR